MRSLHGLRPLLGAGALAAVLAAPRPIAAQFDEPPPPAAYALTGVTLVTAEGARRVGVTVVVRGGFIEAIGPNVQVPEDAKVLEGDSLYVYPGIIDADGKVDLEVPTTERDPDRDPSWAPRREVQGFVPHRQVVDYLTATGDKLAAQRSKGVVAAAVHPTGPIMPGRGTLVLFRKDADRPTALVLTPVLGPRFSFTGASRVYPSTHFGVVAFMRQSFEDARHDGALATAQARDPRGVPAPRWDPDYAVLRDVMAGRVPVFFEANGAEDIRQVLALAEEYGFRPVLVGGGEAWRVAQQLRARQVPVLVSLDFPEPKQWKPKEDGREGAAQQDTTATPQPAEPLDAAAQREKTRLENLYANAGRLAAAGVRVALTSGGGKTDIREGARQAIAYGLSEEQALAAVTRVPAELLGVPFLVRLEPGMPATFTVADGPLFGEETKIAYSFVEGALETGAARKKGPTEAPTVDVSGEWEVEASFGPRTMASKLSLTQEGSDVSGTMESEQGRRPLSGTLSGNELSFSIEFDAGDEVFEISYKGTVSGDRIRGTMSMRMGSGTWTARKVGEPERRTAR